MKVKIGDKIYDSEKEPILVIFAEKDKTFLKETLDYIDSYLDFPETMNDEEAVDFKDLNHAKKIVSGPGKGIYICDYCEELYCRKCSDAVKTISFCGKTCEECFNEDEKEKEKENI